MCQIMPQSFLSTCLHRQMTSVLQFIKWTLTSRLYCSGSEHKDKQQEPRFNAVNIQLLPEQLHKQIFKKSHTLPQPSELELRKVEKHLKDFDLWNKSTTVLKDINFQLPEVHGNNIDEHFKTLALKQVKPYTSQLATLLALTSLPRRPKKWKFQPGWTKYDPEQKKAYSVDYPEEQALVFDVEVLVTEGSYPTLATAVSSKAWYSWCSDRLVNRESAKPNGDITLDRLIPLEPWNRDRDSAASSVPRLVIGHNVGFDRSFVREQYSITGSRLRFLDTMSMHIAISGLTSLQRILYVASKTGSRRKEVLDHEHDQAMFGNAGSFEWLKQSSLNNLNEVYQHYCKGAPLDKSTREIFVQGTIEDVRDQFQELMVYCASDVQATYEVVKSMWPTFLARFPHPVTLAGMLEMGTSYLPINANWWRYVDRADATYGDLEQEMNMLLQRLAKEACRLMKDHAYKNDVWLWDLDWSTKNLKYRKAKKKAKRKSNPDGEADVHVSDALDGMELAAKQPHMPGYPRWYSELCPRDVEVAAGAGLGPTKLTTARRLTPKLLRLTWDGYPLHYDDTHGWGYLVPRLYRDEREADIERQLAQQEGDESDEEEGGDGGRGRKVAKPQASRMDFPQEALLEVVAQTRPDWLRQLQGTRGGSHKADELLRQIHSSTGEENRAALWIRYKQALKEEHKVERKAALTSPLKGAQTAEGPFPDVLPGCNFYKLPHKDGATKRVGNPLAKDFLAKIEEGVLKSMTGNDAEVVLKCSKMCSYWKNNVDRIRGQMKVALGKEELPRAVTQHADYDEDAVVGAILPRVVTAGTVTRRAVEATWLTASNAYTDRVGSELKAMVQSPPGYHFVGADVDSQELWIASVLGDAYSSGLHGCTALGWMTLQGNKADGTDLHSRTAGLVGITRDQAKVFNYGRIYGAGVRFAEQLLRQFNHRLTSHEAKSKAKVMYESTKGRRTRRHLSQEEVAEGKDPVSKWEGGSESAMFNKLEEIATSKCPTTPVLGCQISKALEPQHVAGDFMTSRVNWVVQSSAVDYLHLLLVSMRWLLDAHAIHGRFAISIHDEVRYLVASDDRWRAALALQVTNLLTRAMFAHKLHMDDLPLSVAFFSAVDLDTCLRKEVHLDCVTPSNPHGLAQGYGILHGESFTMAEILERTGGSLKAQGAEPGNQPEEGRPVDGNKPGREHAKSASST